jgi:hypothetical protein
MHTPRRPATAAAEGRCPRAQARPSRPSTARAAPAELPLAPNKIVPSLNLQYTVADNAAAVTARRKNNDAVHSMEEPATPHRSAAAERMLSGAAASKMFEAAEQHRRVAQHRSANMEAQDYLLALSECQGLIRRFCHSPTMERLAHEARFPVLRRGHTDKAVLRALPPEARAKVLRRITSTPKATELAKLSQPRWVVDRSTLKFGKDKTSCFQ